MKRPLPDSREAFADGADFLELRFAEALFFEAVMVAIRRPHDGNTATWRTILADGPHFTRSS
jgi:hypothetical protein